MGTAANTATTTAAGAKRTTWGGRRAANNASPATATEAAQRGCAIVFVDEIDAIGKARVGSPAASGHDERESTLNQLLVEMDGFRQYQVVVLAATNRPDTLDPALLRPGQVRPAGHRAGPDRGGRTRILRIHLRSRHVADDVDVDEMARRTTGFTGADQITLANLEEALATVMLWARSPLGRGGRAGPHHHRLA